jgi:alpha-amylase
MIQHKIRAMADVVINHRCGTTQGHDGVHNRYDGIPMPWDEHAVTSCSGGLVISFTFVEDQDYFKLVQGKI